ncbi:hypothetical protein P153DRAFT_349507, partial [Dothidotthia symphoricarpi CBS 119687]
RLFPTPKLSAADSSLYRARFLASNSLLLLRVVALKQCDGPTSPKHISVFITALANQEKYNIFTCSHRIRLDWYLRSCFIIDTPVDFFPSTNTTAQRPVNCSLHCRPEALKTHPSEPKAT